jgi:hypothetical protein
MADLLFQNGYLLDALEHQLSLVKKEVEAVPDDYVIQANEDAWADALAERYRVAPPELHPDRMWRSDAVPIELDVSRDSMRAISDPEQPFMYPGHRLTVHIPFSGDPGVFALQPSSYTFNPPRATVEGRELLHTIQYPDDRPMNPDPSTQELIRNVNEPWLRVARADIEAHNSDVKDHALQCIRQRRQRIEAHRAVLDQSTIPLGPPDDEKKTYIADAIERLPAPLPPSAPIGKPIELHPALADAEYDHILDVIRRTGRSMEASPGAYEGMGEEDRRHVFLTALNTHYRGTATAEGFNFRGKTDIRIPFRDENLHRTADLFVAECKWWGGEKQFAEAIHQLFDYAAWRDGKLALIVFVRQKALTAIVSKARKALESHEQFEESVATDSTTELRAVMRWPGDDERLVDLHVFFFHFPER